MREWCCEEGRKIQEEERENENHNAERELKGKWNGADFGKRLPSLPNSCLCITQRLNGMGSNKGPVKALILMPEE